LWLQYARTVTDIFTFIYDLIFGHTVHWMVNTLKAKELRTVPDLPMYTYMNIFCEAFYSNLLFVEVRKILLKNIFCTIWELVS